MKKKLAFLLALALLAALVLSGCGKKPVFGVSSNEDNTISVTAERGPRDSVGLGYLSVGEGGAVVIESHFQGDGKIQASLFAGLLGSETFPDEPSYEISTSGESRVSAGVESGEYTVVVKAMNTVTGTALLSVEGGEAPAESDGIAYADDSVTLGDLALRPDGEAGHLYENGGCKLFIPLEYEALLIVDTPENGPDGQLFSVTERASLEAAGGEDGAGWLFGIARVDEARLRELLCQDRSGVEIFARDGEGNYYLYQHPTDVRFVREDNEAMQRDQEIWTALNEWAFGTVRESFLRENSGLEALSYDNSTVGIFVARAAFEAGADYTVSSTAFGPMAPKQLDAAPYAERLLRGARYEYADGLEAPDGEYLVLRFPEEEVRLDFFPRRDGEDLVRIVSGDGSETFYRASLADGAEASAVVQEWYDALVAENRA